jgi:hypothetical protein
MASETLPEDELDRARQAFRDAAAWRNHLPAAVSEAQHRVELYLRRIERSGFDRDSFEALMESWKVVDTWMSGRSQPRADGEKGGTPL